MRLLGLEEKRGYYEGESEMQNDVVDVLLNIGVPAGVKGFSYICDAMVIFDEDAYYRGGKICALYEEIAKRRETTASRVERAIRHAFEAAINKGNQEMVEHYLDTINTQNCNLLRTLYLRLSQEKKRGRGTAECDTDHCELRKQIYQEMMEAFIEEVDRLLKNFSPMDQGELLKIREGMRKQDLA